MNHNRLAKSGMALVRMGHDFGHVALMSLGRRGARAVVVVTMSSVNSGRPGGGMFVMFPVMGARRRRRRDMMVMMMCPGLDRRSGQGEENPGGAHRECGFDDVRHGGFPNH